MNKSDNELLYTEGIIPIYDVWKSYEKCIVSLIFFGCV